MVLGPHTLVHLVLAGILHPRHFAGEREATEHRACLRAPGSEDIRQAIAVGNMLFDRVVECSRLAHTDLVQFPIGTGQDEVSIGLSKGGVKKPSGTTMKSP